MEKNERRAENGATKEKVSVINRRKLILEHRELAQKLGMKLLTSWGAKLSADDFVSAVDLALCEAASRYAPVNSASFGTYLYYFIKGELIETFKELVRTGATGSPENAEAAQAAPAMDPANNDCEMLEHIGDLAPTPDHFAYIRELRAECLDAMQDLTELERLVLLERELFDEKMETVVKKTGYSRGHLFLVQNNAKRKMRSALSSLSRDWKKAA